MDFLQFDALSQGTFQKRYKRFFVDVERPEGHVETVHCANTGSMKSCLVESCRVYTSSSNNPDRKLKSSLELMELPDGLACLNTSRANIFLDRFFERYFKNPNDAFDFDGLQLFKSDFGGYCQHKREAKVSEASRFDFLLEDAAKSRKAWIEVKSVSLRLDESTLAFPDAVTERGQKHIEELMRVAEKGDDAYLFFVLMRGADIDARTLARGFRAAHELDPKYSQMLNAALKANVKARIVVPRIRISGLGMRGYFPLTPPESR